MGLVLKQVSKISGIYGQPGEELISELLASGLPDSYSILNSPRLHFRGAIYDIDHIVVGPNGIFVIETKNMQGRISGGLMGNWIQTRFAPGQNNPLKIGNPANQVMQYAKAVRAFLAARDIFGGDDEGLVKVYPIVVFQREDVDLTGMDFTRSDFIGRVKVAKSNQLLDYIKRRNGVVYSAQEIRSFCELLVPSDQRDQTMFIAVEELAKNRLPSDRYAVFEEIGRGSTGIVYRGYDYKLDREIAVKKLADHNQSSSQAAERFYREAQITQQLDHEAIVKVYDFFEKSSESFMVMELVEGKSMSEYIQGRNISMVEAFSLLSQISAGVAHAHSRDIIHRDLKPSNIMISENGQAKITDFGIARMANSLGMTMEGIGAGTPMTMSPEQIRGLEIGKPSDVFALGVLACCLFFGTMPFAGEHIGEVTHKILYAQPIFPKGAASPQVVSVILKSLAKNPADRYADAAEFLQALEKAEKPDNPVGRHRLERILSTAKKVLFSVNKSEKRVFAVITLLSLAAFIGIMGLQIYKDSRELNREMVLTKQWGFNNENVGLLLENPQIYTGLPVNLVGRLDSIVKSDEQGTELIVAVQEKEAAPEQFLQVSFHQPLFDVRYTSYIKIVGSVQLPGEVGGAADKPLIMADKVEPISDPWTFLAPSQFTVFPHQIVRQGEKAVELEKVEFAEHETRLFIAVSNKGSSETVVILDNPVGMQKDLSYNELKTGYGADRVNTFHLAPGETARKVIFLEPADRWKKSAAFILGSNNDILMGQQPYTFKVSW